MARLTKYQQACLIVGTSHAPDCTLHAALKEAGVRE